MNVGKQIPPPFIYSFLQPHVNRYLLSTYSVPGTVLGTYYEMMNKIGIAPTFQPGNRP